MSAMHNNMGQELPRTWCHKGHKPSSPAIHPDPGGLGEGTSAVGTLRRGHQLARALAGMGGTAPGPGGLAPSGQPLPSAGNTRRYPGHARTWACQEALGRASMCPCIHVSMHPCVRSSMCPQGAPGWTGGQVSPTDPGWDPHREGVGGILCREAWQGGNAEGALRVGIWAAGMRIQGMHELPAPGESSWCSSADLRNQH